MFFVTTTQATTFNSNDTQDIKYLTNLLNDIAENNLDTDEFIVGLITTTTTCIAYITVVSEGEEFKPSEKVINRAIDELKHYRFLLSDDSDEVKQLTIAMDKVSKMEMKKEFKNATKEQHSATVMMCQSVMKINRKWYGN